MSSLNVYCVNNSLEAGSSRQVGTLLERRWVEQGG